MRVENHAHLWYDDKNHNAGGMDVPTRICYIFGSGRYGAEWPKLGADDLIIAADGGYRALEAHGVTPHLLVGDFDSLGYVPDHPQIVRHPVMKDETDTALAIAEGRRRGCGEFRIYGGMGGRLDHTLANLQLLCGLVLRGERGFLVGEDMTATVITAGRLDFPAECSGTLSVFAVGGPAEGVTLTGLKYSLHGAVLTCDVPLGVSNEFTGEPACVAVERGALAVLWRSEPHIPLPKWTKTSR